MRTRAYTLNGVTGNAALIANTTGQPASATAVGPLQSYIPGGTSALAASQAIVTATPMTLTATAAGMQSPSQVTLTAIVGQDASADSFAIVGTDVLGNAISETIAVGPHANTVTSVLSYVTVTSITPTGVAVANVSAGVASSLIDLSATLVTVAAGQALGAGIMTLAAAGVLATPSHITLSSIVDVSAIAFAIVGKDGFGNTISESLAGPLGTGAIVTKTSVKRYWSITSITPGANAAQIVGAGSTIAFAAPAKVTLTSTVDLHLVTFTIIGLNATGGAQTQPGIVGPNANTITTTDTWSAITSITPSAAIVSPHTVSAGIAAGGNSVTAGVNILSASYIFGTQKTFSGFNGTSPQGTPSEVTVTASAAALANTFTITGIDRWGIAPISEVITIAATTAATYQGVNVYSRITSIVASVTDVAPISIGVPARVTSPWVQLNQTRGRDMAELAYWAVDGLVDSPTFTLEGTSASINEQGLGPHGWNDNSYNLPTYYGDDAPIDSTGTPSTFPVQVAPGTQWTRLVLTSGAGSSAIARCVRPSF